MRQCRNKIKEKRQTLLKLLLSYLLRSKTKKTDFAINQNYIYFEINLRLTKHKISFFLSPILQALTKCFCLFLFCKCYTNNLSLAISSSLCIELFRGSFGVWIILVLLFVEWITPFILLPHSVNNKHHKKDHEQQSHYCSSNYSS